MEPWAIRNLTQGTGKVDGYLNAIIASDLELYRLLFHTSGSSSSFGLQLLCSSLLLISNHLDAS